MEKRNTKIVYAFNQQKIFEENCQRENCQNILALQKTSES